MRRYESSRTQKTCPLILYLYWRLVRYYLHRHIGTCCLVVLMILKSISGQSEIHRWLLSRSHLAVAFLIMVHLRRCHHDHVETLMKLAITYHSELSLTLSSWNLSWFLFLLASHLLNSLMCPALDVCAIRKMRGRAIEIATWHRPLSLKTICYYFLVLIIA